MTRYKKGPDLNIGAFSFPACHLIYDGILVVRK
jgi:hypothetical protein